MLVVDGRRVPRVDLDWDGRRVPRVDLDWETRKVLSEQTSIIENIAGSG